MKPAPLSCWLVIVECQHNVIKVAANGSGFFIPGQEPCWHFSHVHKWIKQIWPPPAKRGKPQTTNQKGQSMKSKKLTTAQKRKIINVIKKDAKIRSQYIDENTGETCVIGGLALAAGMDLKKRVLYNEQNSQSITSELLERFCHDLSKAYGLTANQMADLQCINDRQVRREDRQAELIRKVESF